MTYRGHIENGAVVFDDPAPIPEGAAVEITVAEVPPCEQEPMSEPLQRIMEFAGSITGLPEDASTNLDHYLYGHPKK